MPVPGLDPGIVAGVNGALGSLQPKKDVVARTGHDSEMNGFNTSGNRMSWMHGLPRPNRIHDQPIDASVARAVICPRSMRGEIAWGELKSAPPSWQC
jgi:hypothetical protein